MGNNPSKHAILFTKDIEDEYDRFVRERREKELRTLRESNAKNPSRLRDSARRSRRDDE